MAPLFPVTAESNFQAICGPDSNLSFFTVSLLCVPWLKVAAPLTSARSYGMRMLAWRAVPQFAQLSSAPLHGHLARVPRCEAVEKRPGCAQPLWTVLPLRSAHLCPCPLHRRAASWPSVNWEPSREAAAFLCPSLSRARFGQPYGREAGLLLIN